MIWIVALLFSVSPAAGLDPSQYPACCCISGTADIILSSYDEQYCAAQGGSIQAGPVTSTAACSAACSVTQCTGSCISAGACSDYGSSCAEAEGSCSSGQVCCTSDPGMCTPPVGSCNTNSSTVKPVINPIRDDRGYKQITIKWENNINCPATSYDILRCIGQSCVLGNLVTDLPGSTKNYTDTTVVWDQYYTYAVKAKYAGITAARSSDSKVYYSGNTQCAGRYTEARFCTDQTIPGKNAYCSEVNVLTDETACSSGERCAGGICFSGEECTPAPDLDEGKPFGLFYTQESCEGTEDSRKYCFLDRSSTIVNSCYQCVTSMTCYDYKSKSACETDSCSAGMVPGAAGSCEWHDTYPELGLGVCVDTEKNNCVFCSQKGNLNATNLAAYNDFFDLNTPQKVQALSTEKYPCFVSNNACSTCGDKGCQVYTSEATCNPGNVPVTLNYRNEIVAGSSDSCNIRACEWINNQCQKDADGVEGPDCPAGSTKATCEQDIYKPEALVTAVLNNDTSISAFKFTVLDQVKSSSLKATVAGYPVFYCTSASSNCAAQPAGLYKSTTNTLLTVGLYNNELRLCDGVCSASSFSLTEGQNTLYYYARDQSGNLGIVQTYNFTASSSTIGPVPYNVTILDSREKNSIAYTKDSTPAIKISFSIPAKLNFHQLKDTNNTAYTVPALPSGFDLVQNIGIAQSLAERSYKYSFTAISENGRALTTPYIFQFVVDTTSPAVNISPVPGTTNRSSVGINLSFSEQVVLNNVLLNGFNLTNLTTANNQQYQGTAILSDGVYTLVVEAEDYAGNAVTGTRTFEVNAQASLVINLSKPKYGISPTQTFDFEVKTDNAATCRYALDDPGLGFNQMTSFTSSNNYTHLKVNIANIPPDQEGSVTVRCRDSFHASETVKTFTLGVDLTPPEVSVEAYPSSIALVPPSTTLKANTNDAAVCIFNSTDDAGNFSSMSLFAFQTSHQATIHPPSAMGTYTYTAWCMNRAELNSTATTTVYVDTSAQIQIVQRSPFTFTNTTITLRIATNVDTYCRFSPYSDMTTVQSFTKEVTNVLYHNATFTVNGSGKYYYYAQCYDNRDSTGGWQPSQPVRVEFTIDTTPPAMLYVNDSSKENDTEITYKKNELRVKWLGQDNESEIARYYYRLRQSNSSAFIFNWTESTKEDEWVYVEIRSSNGSKMNLTSGQRYQFEVRAENTLGANSSPIYSDGISVDSNSVPGSCTNNAKDSSETDIDCGGVCPRCTEVGDSCSTSDDCALTLYCASTKTCQYPTCRDDVVNGNESDTDCGGNSCDECDLGDKCKTNSDCTSNYCDASTKTCKEPDQCHNNKLDPGKESDIDCGGSCSKCTEGKNCDLASDCAGGLACISGTCRADSDGDGKDDTDDNCPEDANFDQIDQDEDGFGDACDTDMDGDGLSNQFEQDYNFDPTDRDQDANGILDGEDDTDSDGLINKQEEQYGTDPRKEDTDSDGFSDKTEVDAGTDPTDPNSKPGSSWILFWILLVLVAILTILYLFGFSSVRKSVVKEKVTIKPQPQLRQQPVRTVWIQPQQRSASHDAEMQRLLDKKKQEREDRRKTLLSAFGAEKGQPVPEKKSEQASEQKSTSGPNPTSDQPPLKTASPADQKDTWSILSALRPRQQKSSPADGSVFKKLEEISKGQKDLSRKVETIRQEPTVKIIPVKIPAKAAPPKKVYTTPSGLVFHKPGCITVKGKKGLVSYASPAAAAKEGLDKCKVCFPAEKKRKR